MIEELLLQLLSMEMLLAPMLSRCIPKNDFQNGAGVLEKARKACEGGISHVTLFHIELQFQLYRLW